MSPNSTDAPLHGRAAGAGYPVADGGVGVGALIGGLWRRKALILFLSVLIVGGTGLFLLMATPKFTSEGRLLIEDRETVYTRSTVERVPLTAPDLLAIQSEVQVLLSQDLALGVIEELGLATHPAFGKSNERSVFDLALKLAGLRDGAAGTSGNERLLEKFSDGLLVHPVPNSRVIAVSFTSTDPQLAAKIVNTLLDRYVNATQMAKFESTRQATEWLGQRIRSLQRRVADADQKIETFRAQSGLLEGAASTLDRQELSELNSQITLAAAARSDAQARADAIKDMLQREGGVESAPEVLNSRLIQRLAEQQASLRSKIADLSVTYLPNHPNMKRLEAELLGLDRQIRREALKIAEGLEEQAQAASDREQGLRNRLAELKTQVALTNQDGARLSALQREADANKKLLDSYLSRYREASTRDSATSVPPGARIISTAQVRSTPSFPKKGPILLFAVIGSLVFGVLVAFAGELVSQSGAVSYAQPIPVRHDGMSLRAADARQHPAAPEAHGEMPAMVHAAGVDDSQMLRNSFDSHQPAGTIYPPVVALPRIDGVQSVSDLPRNVVYDSGSAYATAIQKLHEALASRLDASGARRIVVTSSHDGLGRTTVAASLARSLARSGMRTLVLDADLLHAGLGEALNIPKRGGLAELMLGEASFREVVTTDEASGTDVITAGFSTGRAAGLLASGRMELILNALDKAYERIVLDAPSVLDSEFGGSLGLLGPQAVALVDGANIAQVNTIASKLMASGCTDVVTVDASAMAGSMQNRARGSHAA